MKSVEHFAVHGVANYERQCLSESDLPDTVLYLRLLPGPFRPPRNF